MKSKGTVSADIKDRLGWYRHCLLYCERNPPTLTGLNQGRRKGFLTVWEVEILRLFYLGLTLSIFQTVRVAAPRSEALRAK